MSHEILTHVGNTLLGGVEFHSRMIDYYSFLCQPCFRESQCYHLKDELKNFHQFIGHVCDQHKILLKCHCGTLPEIIPPEFYTKSMMALDEASVKNYLKQSLKHWLEWEEGTKSKLIECADQLLEEHAHADYHYVRELIDDVVCEIYCIESLLLDLRMVSYETERVPHLRHKLGIK